MDISSISLTNMFASSRVEPVAIDPIADVVVGSVVAIGVVGDNDVAKVEGTTVVTIGMTVIGKLSRLYCLSNIKLYNSFSISFN